MINETTRWPLDIEGLKKGDRIKEVELLNMSGLTKDSQEHQLYVLALSDRIMKERERIGEPFTVVARKGDLVILTDIEAADYNHHKSLSYIRRATGAYFRKLNVDDSGFDEAAKVKHRRESEVVGKGIQGCLMGMAEQLQIEPYKRKTPGLPAGETI